MREFLFAVEFGFVFVLSLAIVECGHDDGALGGIDAFEVAGEAYLRAGDDAEAVLRELESEEDGTGAEAVDASFDEGADGVSDGELDVRRGLEDRDGNFAATVSEIAVEPAVGLAGEGGSAALFLVELDVGASAGVRVYRHWGASSFLESQKPFNTESTKSTKDTESS